MPLRRHHLLVLTLLGLAACGRPATDPASPPTEPVATSPAPAPAPAPAPVPAANEAPEAFRGEWNADLAACGGGGNDTRLVIDADRMQFYEGRGEIVAVKLAGPGEAVFALRLSSEGETADVTYRFRLSADGATLTDVENGGLARRRCPG
jgi:hypothetical protein